MPSANSVGLPFVLALFALAALAGCIGGDDAQPKSTEPTTAPTGGFDETTGALEGVVTDDELQRVGGAQVQLREIKNVTSSALDGSFSFSRVPPGKYHLDAEKIGFERTSQTVEIAAGQVTKTRVALVRVPIVEPRHVTTIWDGHVVCSVAQQHVGYSEECGEGVGNPVGPPIGGNPNNNIDWIFNLTLEDDALNIQTLLIELDWKPASAAATELSLHVARDMKCEPTCEWKKAYCSVNDNHGPPVMKCVIQKKDLDLKSDKDLPAKITARVWAAPSATGTVVLEQDFTFYRTIFWGEPMTEGFTAVEQ